MTTSIYDRIHALPFWRGPVKVSPLLGGLSNESFTVRDRAGTWVVRFGEDYPFHHVDRTRELMVSRAAAGAGFAPEVAYAEPGVTISAFIDGHTYGEADVRRDRSRILALLRRFHTEMPAHVSGTATLFWPFHVIRDYARTIRAAGHAFSALPVDDWLELTVELEAEQVPLPICFGHHDLLPANLIDDGQCLWLIDFEYAAYGTPMFDLANLSSNAGFSAEEDVELLTEYFDAAPSAALIDAYRGMKCASLLREAMWSYVSHIQFRHREDVFVDYLGYAEEYLERLEDALFHWRRGR
ncbi:MAG: choline/ethanolamine kinase family protein [Pseudomonadota bacterium]